MAGQSQIGPPVRLRPPYPELPAPGKDSFVHLALAASPGGRPLPEPLLALARPAGDGRGAGLALSCTWGALQAALAQLAPAQLEAEPVPSLVRALEGTSKPPSPLPLGDRTWEFGLRTYILGVVNVTPDSFSGDGVADDPQGALARARRLVEEGADAIDLGGESTRPGHLPVTETEELRRLLPALRLIISELSVPVFVDTSKATVAAAVLDAGASGINDIWGLRRDTEMADVVARAGVPVVCMHNRHNHDYLDLLGELIVTLEESLAAAARAGIPKQRVILDPGIGFGKVPAQNYEVLRRLAELRVLGCALLVGTSRKSLIGWLLDERPVAGRLLGTAASCAWAIAQGADIVRVHDVAEIRDVARVTDALVRRLPV